MEKFSSFVGLVLALFTHAVKFFVPATTIADVYQNVLENWDELDLEGRNKFLKLLAMEATSLEESDELFEIAYATLEKDQEEHDPEIANTLTDESYTQTSEPDFWYRHLRDSILTALLDINFKFYAEVNGKLLPIEQAIAGDNAIAQSLRNELSDKLGIEISEFDGPTIKPLIISLLMSYESFGLQEIAILDSIIQILAPEECQKNELLQKEVLSLFEEEVAEA